jgi:S1-C subfamily serine protease
MPDIARTVGHLARVTLGALGLICAGCGSQNYLGLQIEDSNGPARTAVMISQVGLLSAGANGGLEPNDIIVSFNHTGVTSIANLQQQLALIPLGSTIPVTVFRPGVQDVVEPNVVLDTDPNNVPTSLGINIQASTTPVGVAILSVTDGSPADVAGLNVGDIITKFGSTAVGTVDQFRRALAAATENSSVVVTFRRLPSVTDDTTTATITYSVISTVPLLGLAVQDLSAQLADTLGYPALGGVTVIASMIDGTAFDAGIMPHDTIFLYGTTKITKTSDLVNASRASGGTGTVDIAFSRGGDILSVPVTLRGSLPAGTYTQDVGVSLLATPLGLEIVALVTGGYAATASLQLDDLITAVNGVAVPTVQDFYKQINAALNVRPVVTYVTLTTLRSGVTVLRTMTIRTTSSSSKEIGAKAIFWEL